MKRTIIFSFLFTLIAGGAFSVIAQESERARDEVVVVANANLDIRSVSKANLARVYRGKADKLNGMRVVPVQLSTTHEATARFLDVVLGETASGYKKYWVKQALMGGAKPPKDFDTAAAAARYIATKDIAIGYLPKSLVDDKLRILEVDGDQAL